MASSFYENMKKLRSDEKTKNAGKPWTTEDDSILDNLLDELLSKHKEYVLSLDDYTNIAKKLFRTPTAIMCRIRDNAIKFKLDHPEENDNDVAMIFGLEKDDFTSAFSRRKSSVAKKRRTNEKSVLPERTEQKQDFTTQLQEIKKDIHVLRIDIALMYIDIQRKLENLCSIILMKHST